MKLSFLRVSIFLFAVLRKSIPLSRLHHKNEAAISLFNLAQTLGTMLQQQPAHLCPKATKSAYQQLT